MIDVVAAVIMRNGRLLLTQRAPEQDAPWLWHCPGGKCEGPTQPGVAGESWEDAAIRETREELGLDGPVTLPRDERGNVTPIAELAYERGSEGSAAVWIAWYAVDIGDQKPLPIEGIGVGWFTPVNLMAMASRPDFLTRPTVKVLNILLRHIDRG